MSVPSRPNILVLLSDQQQYATVAGASCMTPNLDRLRASGVTFTSARTVNPICSPARASLMTGLLPHNHGMVDNTHCVEPFRANLRNDIATLPGVLKEAGYALGYFGKWHVDRGGDPGEFGFDRCETEHHGRDFPRTLNSVFTVSHEGYNERVLYGVHEEPVDQTEEQFFYSEAIEFIRAESGESRPWCTFVSSNAPHDPYIAPREMYELYSPDDIELPASFADPMDDKPNIYRRLRTVWADLEPAHYREAIACYYANCSMVDRLIGGILEELRSSGEIENTIVLFMSDHGDLMGAHGLLCKGVPAFEEGYHIPLVVSWPGHIDPGSTCDALVSTIDVAPTLLDLAGCDPIPGADGRSLVPQFQDGAPGRASCYAEFFGQRLSYSQRIVWQGDFKYVYDGFDFDEFYDLRRDPAEMRNLINDPEYQPHVEELCREMWRRAKESNDESFLESEYFTYRFAPVGPERTKRASIYNRGA